MCSAAAAGPAMGRPRSVARPRSAAGARSTHPITQSSYRYANRQSFCKHLRLASVATLGQSWTRVLTSQEPLHSERERDHCNKTRPSRAHSQARSGPCLDGWSSALRSAASQLTASKQRTSTLMGSRMTLPTPLKGWSGAMRSFGCPALAHAGAVGREGELQDEL